MTRTEFINEVTAWYELIDFCNDNGCDELENICDDDYRDEYINDNLVEWARYDGWRDLLSRLQDFDEHSGYDYYRYDEDYCEYVGLDHDDFADYKQRVLEWADDHDDVWYSEEDEEADAEMPQEEQPLWKEEEPWLPEEDDDEPVPEEDYSFDEMLGFGIGCVRNISARIIEENREEEKAFADLIF